MGKLTDMTERYLGKSTSTASLVTSKTASDLGLDPPTADKNSGFIAAPAFPQIHKTDHCAYFWKEAKRPEVFRASELAQELRPVKGGTRI